MWRNSNEKARDAIASILTLVGVVGFLPFALYPVLTVGQQCPEGSIASGSMSSSWLALALGLSLLISSYICLVQTIYPCQKGKRRFKYAILDKLACKHERLFITALMLGSIIGGAYWLSGVEAYYCLTSTGIILHPSMFEAGKFVGWNDVQAVNVECRHGKNGSYGGLNVSVSLDHTFWVTLGQGENDDVTKYEAIRKMLQKYNLGIASSINNEDTVCPSGILRLLHRPA